MKPKKSKIVVWSQVISIILWAVKIVYGLIAAMYLVYLVAACVFPAADLQVVNYGEVSTVSMSGSDLEWFTVTTSDDPDVTNVYYKQQLVLNLTAVFLRSAIMTAIFVFAGLILSDIKKGRSPFESKAGFYLLMVTILTASFEVVPYCVDFLMNAMFFKQLAATVTGFTMTNFTMALVLLCVYLLFLHAKKLEEQKG